MHAKDNTNIIEDICTNCIIKNCPRMGTAGFLPYCPKDPELAAYLEAFRQRYKSKPEQ